MARTVFTILGCGSSPGVPRIGNDWGACDPSNPKNERLRCSLLVERFNGEAEPTRVLIDTSPDLRFQMLKYKVDRIDGVLFTHSHADHIHGIDDLRAFWINQRKRVDTYADEATAERLYEGFRYCYESPPGSDYPPIATDKRIQAYEPVTIDGPGGPLTALPYEQVHGNIISLGFRFGSFAYSSDVNDFNDETFKHLQGVETFVVDALRYTPHVSHFSVDQAIEAAKRIGARRTILTHMHIDLDYEELIRRLPEGVEPAFDGMQIEVLD